MYNRTKAFIGLVRSITKSTTDMKRETYKPIRPYSEDLFDRDEHGEPEQAGSKEVDHYRVRLTYAGKNLSADFYPVWNTKGRQRARKHARTREAVQKVNDRNARRKFVWLLSANFEKDDLDLSLTYTGPPPELPQVKKDLQNYLRRLRRLRAKLGLPELKYLYYIHGGHLAPDGHPLRVHIHLIVNAMDRDAAETLWTYGTANSRRLRPDNYEDGLDTLGHYLTRRVKMERMEQEANVRRWGYSQNLQKPVQVYPKHRLSRKRAVLIVKDYEEARRIIEKQFPKYKLLDMQVAYSSYVGGAYIYTTLRKRE